MYTDCFCGLAQLRLAQSRINKCPHHGSRDNTTTRINAFEWIRSIHVVARAMTQIWHALWRETSERARILPQSASGMRKVPREPIQKGITIALFPVRTELKKGTVEATKPCFIFHETICTTKCTTESDNDLVDERIGMSCAISCSSSHCQCYNEESELAERSTYTCRMSWSLILFII